MNDKRLVKNIGVSMIMKPISLVLSFVYTPLALNFLGDEKYGIWAIILNIISWINFFDIGIGNGLRNKLAEAIALGDEDKAKSYVSTAYFGTTLISIGFCIIVTFTWNFFELTDFFNLSVSDENTNTVIFISVLFVCVNFVLSLSKTSAYAIQQPGIISVVGVIGQTLQIAIIIIISNFFNKSLVTIALMYGIISLFDNIVIYLFIRKHRIFLRPSFADINLNNLKLLLTLGIGFFALQICSLVLNTTDNLLISNLYGSEDVTPYSIVYKVFYLLTQLHGIVIMPMWSAYTEAATRKDMKWINNTMKKINLITLGFSAMAVIGIILFRPLSVIWLRRELQFSTSLIIIVAIYMIVQMFANNYSSFLCGVGHIKTSVIISLIGTFLNIPLSILFARDFHMNLTGIILGSLFVMTINAIALPIVTVRWKKLKVIEWENNKNERYI